MELTLDIKRVLIIREQTGMDLIVFEVVGPPTHTYIDQEEPVSFKVNTTRGYAEDWLRQVVKEPIEVKL